MRMISEGAVGALMDSVLHLGGRYSHSFGVWIL